MMKSLHFARYAVSLSLTAAMLAGCGGSQRALSPSASLPALAQPSTRGTGEVQYFADFGSSTLFEFDFPKSTVPIGSISFGGGAECTQGARTFWTVGSSEIAEFKVGGTTPIGALKASAAACAIDPASGNLAATILTGSVIIFHSARGRGKVIAALSQAYFDGYDEKSDLFVDGFGRGGAFGLVELRKGGSAFKTITTSNTVQFPGSVQWDGTYLTVFDQVVNAIYRYTVRGTKATLHDTVRLSGSSDCAQTWIAGSYAYCADAGTNGGEVYKYPAGGLPTATLSGPFNGPAGVVSLRVR